MVRSSNLLDIVMPRPSFASLNSNIYLYNTTISAAATVPFFLLRFRSPRRSAILLIGGDKTGDDRFYERMVPIADQLYDVYLAEIRKEGLIP
jgi:hypothetical protein